MNSPSAPSIDLRHTRAGGHSAWRMLHPIRLGIRFYQVFLSPLLSYMAGPAAGCRVSPVWGSAGARVTVEPGPAGERRPMSSEGGSSRFSEQHIDIQSAEPPSLAGSSF